ncbi:MAG: ATP-binding protein [Propionibacteriaceae bacterium]|jgi:predicted AAA+ superfamily ATPase|nr:ATP-binding protein [Propionibacteriaceae bacterium]
MERLAILQLEAWKRAENRKPLVLRGARQVGKTWLAKEFGKRYYQQTAYINFEETPSLAAIFEGDFDIPRIVAALRAATEIDILPGETLIILDEIQECPRALTALKYFNEKANDYHIIAAGSLLGVALHEGSSFPVGKVTFLDIGPLSLAEFIQALGHDQLWRSVAESNWELMSVFHDRLVSLLRDYLFVGGMPAAVLAFATNLDYQAARTEQSEILKAYDSDFSKHSPAEQVPKIRAVWESIPRQLAKERKRFFYGDVASGARARSHETAIEWLAQAGVVERVRQISAPRLPLTGYDENDAFKLFLVDVGLLGALAALPTAAVINGSAIFTEFRGALTEQYVATQLKQQLGASPRYWTNGQNSAEVDFVIQRGLDIIPIEVKANRNLKSKSLQVYREKFAPPLAIRTSLAPYARSTSLVDLPLYALATLSML